MIFYFSGTGNSLYVAKNIAQENDEKLVSIADAISEGKGCYEYNLKENEVIGFVHPTYAWGPPKMVTNFIEKLKFNNYKNNYIFTVATCAASVGNAVKSLEDSLKKKNLNLKSGFSILMPNNYILTKNVDTRQDEKNKLAAADDTLKTINKVIKERQVGVYQVEKGSMAALKTAVVNPVFYKKLIDTRKFYVTDKCISCGLCATVCNTKTIKFKKTPSWGTDCTLCLACVHLCPSKAIQYGKNTEIKGRYKNPNIDVNELKTTI